MDFIKKNWIYILGGLVALFLFFPGMFRKKAVRHRRHKHVAVVSHRRHRTHRALPRSVGIRKRAKRSHGAKKPWQIKGSLAARRRMAQIRRKR